MVGLPPATPRLSTPDVTLHVLSAEELRPDRAAFEAELSPEERERASRFRADVHRERFVLRRGALRRLLAKELGVPPGRVRYLTGAHGKPRLDGGGPCFSTSASGDLFAVAVSASLEAGVDVERLLARADLEDVARHAFSPVLRARLAALDAEARPAAFYRIWTIEEAVGKLDGRGIADGMPVADVPPDVLTRGGRWSLPSDAGRRARSIETISLGADAVLSLATMPRSGAEPA